MSKLDAISTIWALAAYCVFARAVNKPRTVLGDAGLTAMMCALTTLGIMLL